MADFTIGDYGYTVTSGTNVRAEVVDRTKSGYANVPSTVTYGGTTYTVTSLSSCFRGCTSLTQAPSIPSSVTSLNSCFYGCTSLAQAPTIPSSVTNMSGCFYGCTSLAQAPSIPNSVTSLYSCFSGCTSLTQAPSIPSSVTDMSYCFYNCTSLTQAPSIPSSVTYMGYCFDNCTSLTQAPTIPSSVTSLYFCFRGCTSLAGNVRVANNPTSYTSCFYNTTNDLYIIPSGLSSAAIETWRTIASGYSNVHYYYDDATANPFTFNVTRVASSGSTTPAQDSGTYAYIEAVYKVSYLPSGISATRALTRDGTAISPSWTATTSAGVTTAKAWLSQAATTKATYALTLSAGTFSASLSATLLKAAVLLDFHAGGDGIGIGTVSTRAGLEIAMNTTFDGAGIGIGTPSTGAGLEIAMDTTFDNAATTSATGRAPWTDGDGTLSFDGMPMKYVTNKAAAVALTAPLPCIAVTTGGEVYLCTS